MDNTNFIAWVKEKMRERAWRQADLANAAHIDPAVVSNILSGKRGPGLDTCTSIARAFDIPPGVVLEAAGLLGRKSSAINDAYISEINSIYEKFNNENKREAIEFFRMLLRLQEDQTNTI